MMLKAIKLKATWHIIASRPHVIIVPVALTLIMMGLGIFGVLIGASHSADSSRMKAAVHVEAVASTMQLSIQQALMPALQLADWMSHALDYNVLQSQWMDRVPGFWKRAPPASSHLSIAPFGVISNVWPINNITSGRIGLDVLADPARRAWAIKGIQTNDICASDPALLEGIFIMTFTVPIMVRNVSESETFNIPANRTTKGCSPGLCYNETTRTRWWGTAGLTVNVSTFLTSNVLANLGRAGYKLQVWRPANPLNGETARVAVDEQGARPQPADAVRGVVLVADVQWEVYVWADSWEPKWKLPFIGMVVAVSVVCGCLIFAILLSWEENRLLLHSILPKQTIKRMKTEMDWKTSHQDKESLRLVEIETPAQHMLTIIQAILTGEAPPMALVVAVRQALQRSVDVYSPATQDVRSRINAGNLDREVQQALVQQLAGRANVETLASEALDVIGQTDLEEIEDLMDCHFMTFRDIMIQNSGPLSVLGGAEASSRNSVPLPDRNKPKRNLTRTSCVAPGAATYPNLQAMLTILIARRNSVRPATILTESSDFLIAVGPNSKDVSVDFPLTLASPSAARLHRQPSSGGLKLPSGAAAPEKPIMEQLDRVLGTVNSWEFDAFELDEITHGHALSVLSYYLIHTSGCMEFARMDGYVLARFLRKVEKGYKAHPYHNSRHAADVLQTFHVILHQGGLVPGYCDQLTLLGCYLAAVVHDYEHHGVSNDFLINTLDELAVRYNDRSPMENHHLAAAWGLMLQPGFNCLGGLSKPNWDKLRKLVIDLVLATDMRQHFAILGQFSTLHSTTGASATPQQPSVGGHGDNGNSPRTTPVGLPPTPSGDHDKLVSLQVAIKCADIGHLAAPLPVHLRWVAALEEELFLQGDGERERGMTISPLCDRTKEGVTKSQVGFFDFVVLPLTNNFTQKFKASRPLLKAVVSNYRYWQDKAAQVSNT